jgi:hypothetical protein
MLVGGGGAAKAAVANTVGANIYYQAVLVGNQLDIGYECQGGGLPLAASVTIKCGINGLQKSVSLPGPVAYTDGGALMPVEPFSICWEADAVFVIGSSPLSTSGCTAPSLQTVGKAASHTDG